MNLKKHIRLKQETLTEKEEQLYNSLLQRVSANSVAKKRVSLWKILTPIISFMGVAAITLSCIFTVKTPVDLIYNDEKIENKESTYSEMQLDIIYFDLTAIDTSSTKTLIYYDTESNDKLYYNVFANIDLLTLDLIIVINEKYNYKFEINNDAVTKQLADYSVTYSSEASRGKPEINYKGYIKVQTEIVYFDYLQVPALGDEAFLISIGQIIQVKK